MEENRKEENLEEALADVSAGKVEAPSMDAETIDVDALQTEINALKDAVLRERAENENLRKRQERELQNTHKFATERLIKDLFPVLDSLTLGIDAARRHAPEGQNSLEEFIKGSEMTIKVLLETLLKYGVQEINPLNEKFNPELHQALTTVPNPGVEANTIVHVAQKGYVLYGRVIRAAQVIVVGNE